MAEYVLDPGHWPELPPMHRAFLDRALPMFQADARLAGLAAGGSFATGELDECSDLDLVVVSLPGASHDVLREGFDIAERFGPLLAAFPGDHVGEARLLICLYGPPLLHVPAPSRRPDDPLGSARRPSLRPVHGEGGVSPATGSVDRGSILGVGALHRRQDRPRRAVRSDRWSRVRSGSGARSSRPVPGRRAAQRCAPRRTERAGARSSAPIDPGFTRSRVLAERAGGHGRALHGSARAARFPDPGSEDRCRARSQELPHMTSPEFMVIAHRGASSYAPENTLAAFDLAIQMGVSHIELDVHSTRDDHVVVIHDDTVNRTTNGSGPVTSHALAALQGLDAGSWFGGKFAGQRIPTFEEVLERYQGRAHLHTEIKGHSAHLSQRTADLVRRRGMTGQVTITSFQRTRLEEARAHAPELPRGWLVTEVSDATIAQARALGLSQLCPRANAVTPELVHRLHAEGFVVRAWGVATEDQMRQVVQAGADGMTVNFPDKLLAYLKS